MKYIWKYFTDLNRKRTGTGYGPLSIQYSEMLAYFELMGIYCEPIEIEILILLDDIAMEYYNTKLQEEANKAKSKSKK